MANHWMLLIAGNSELERRTGAAAGDAGLRLRVAKTLTEGVRAYGEGSWRAVVMSADLPGFDFPLVERLKEEGRAGAVILLSSEPTIELVMEATRAGASELLSTDFHPAELRALLEGVGTRIGQVRLPVLVSEGELVGGSRALLEVFKQVGRVASSGATVLVTGATGTGKEVVARSIHRKSPRASRPFVAVNCAAIPEDLLESELFGHERGAFTGAVARKIGRFERADGGTVFLDEIGDMSLVLQAKILRVLQEREIERVGGEASIGVNVRVVAATHRDLQGLVAAGEFREDLYYRLAVVRLHLPALRERPEDIRGLALHYAARFAREHGRPIEGIGNEAIERLTAHPWSGNVRELRNVLERAVLAARGTTILAEHLGLEQPRAQRPEGEDLPGYSTRSTLAEVEALHIAQVLGQVQGHLGKAAEILGVHRNTVSRKAQEYGIGVS